MIEKILEASYIQGKQEILDIVLGKPYKISELKKITYETKYNLIGKGVLDTSNIEKLSGKELLKYIENNFILIQNQQDFDNFKNKLMSDEQEKENQKNIETKEWQDELMKAVEQNTPEKTSKELKDKIFTIVLECSIKKNELEKDYWEVFDIVNNAEKTRNIFNVKPNIKLNKNDFPQKNRKI